MCRSTEIHGFYQNERDRLKIKAFYLRLSISQVQKPLPESFTLLYLPRINGSLLEINDLKIRSDSSGFVTLYRIRSEEEKKMMMMNDEEIGEVVFASRERVRASEGVQFEVYSKEEKVLKGIFRKDEDEEWKMECKCALESDPVGFKISEAEVFVGAEGNVAMNEKVEMVVRRRRMRRKTMGKFGFRVLEEIPEEREIEIETESCDSDYCCCYCGEMETELDGGDCETMDDHEEMEKEGGTWAVDVGIWVMCLGVGYLVSKASSRTLRRRILR
ncbi:hypothetical protein BVC80_883g27 [Macleaya cordata]|uniref:Uncharacterized protein n=1 Tax=Macleaya cordata TaxID=56857 RepID=A0A200RDA0_MACCD|nr:hypothetical protein BVC80_883g27 [Macleaya cordata]